jgi:hypothetical protein
MRLHRFGQLQDALNGTAVTARPKCNDAVRRAHHWAAGVNAASMPSFRPMAMVIRLLG